MLTRSQSLKSHFWHRPSRWEDSPTAVVVSKEKDCKVFIAVHRLDTYVTFSSRRPTTRCSDLRGPWRLEAEPLLHCIT